MLCLFHVPNATQAATPEAYGFDLDRAYAQCPRLEWYVEFTIHLSGTRQFRHDMEDLNVNTIVAHYNNEVRARHFDCWRTRRLAPRLVNQYDAVAAAAQANFGVEAERVKLSEFGEDSAMKKIWKNAVAIDLAKTRAECVRNASAVAVKNAVKCAMAWDDVPEAERQLYLPFFVYAHGYERALQGIRSTVLSNTTEERYMESLKMLKTYDAIADTKQVLRASDRCEILRGVF